MNLGKYEKALACFLKSEHSKDALPYIINCYREMGDLEQERVFREKLEAHGAESRVKEGRFTAETQRTQRE